MNIKEVFDKCKDNDFVKDSDNYKWKVNEGGLTNDIIDITDFYSLKELFDLQFKKVYKIDWSKVEVDTKILVSNDDIRWYHAHFAMFENDTIYTFSDGTTSFTCECNNAFEPWQYAKIYEEEK